MTMYRLFFCNKNVKKPNRKKIIHFHNSINYILISFYIKKNQSSRNMAIQPCIPIIYTLLGALTISYPLLIIKFISIRFDISH